MLAITGLRIFNNTQSAVKNLKPKTQNQINYEEIPATKSFYEWMLTVMKRQLMRMYGKSEEYADQYVAKFNKDLMEKAHKELPEYFFSPGMENYLYAWLNKRALEENRRMMAEGPKELSAKSGKRFSIIA